MDCANGVGAPKLRELLKFIAPEILSVDIVNEDTTTVGQLNKNCGADFVKTNQRAPPSITITAGDRCCSYDGDADRIVFYYVTEDGTFRLLDGDKIAGLAASFITELVHEAGIDSIKVGVVQTAYANGSSTNYLTKVLVRMGVYLFIYIFRLYLLLYVECTCFLCIHWCQTSPSRGRKV